MTKKLRLLVVEDDPVQNSLLIAFLEKEDFQVTGAATAREALELLNFHNFDMVLLDLFLPDEDGLVLAEKLRAQMELPIIFVTRHDEDDARIHALEIGGGDYITKPFNPRELAARIRNISKRIGQGSEATGQHNCIAFAGWMLDLERRNFKCRTGQEEHLTRAEFDLLATLAKAQGRVLTRDYLINEISRQGEEISDRNVDVMVSRLRKKVDPYQELHKMIITVSGHGYKFGIGVEMLDAARQFGDTIDV